MFHSFKTPAKSILKSTQSDDAPNAPRRLDPRVNPNQGAYIFQAEELYKQTLTAPIDNQVHYLGVYMSRFIRHRCREMMGADYPFASAYSISVRNLKGNKTETNRSNAVEFFSNMLLPLISHNSGIVIASVPTSTPRKIDSHGITLIARELARRTNNIDGTKVITRVAAKQPCHEGGEMTREAILKGLNIDADQIKGKAVLLLDDVVKTGLNLTALSALLYECGATRVVCLALAGVLNKQNQKLASESVLEKYLREKIRENQTQSHMKESLYHAFAAVRQAFPNTPQPEFLPLRRAQIKEASAQYASRINFDADDANYNEHVKMPSQDTDSSTDIDENDPGMLDLVTGFSNLEVSSKKRDSSPRSPKDEQQPKRVRFANG